MTPATLGDLALPLLLQRSQTAIKTDMQRLSQQLADGTAADRAAHLGGDLSTIAGLEASLARIEGFRQANAQSTLIAQAMQTGLETLGTLASDLSSRLLTASTSGGALAVSTIATDARQRLDAAIAMLNTRVGEVSVFAGTGTSGAAVADAAAILAAVSPLVAGASTAGEVEAAVASWFGSPSGFVATGYLGGPARGPVAMGEGQSATLDVTADDPALRQILKGLVMAALVDRGALTGNGTEQAELVGRSGTLLAGAETGRSYLAAGIGFAQTRIEGAAVAGTALRSALSIARSDLLSVDPYETSVRLEETETLLNMVYAVTARMARLTLADYL